MFDVVSSATPASPGAAVKPTATEVALTTTDALAFPEVPADTADGATPAVKVLAVVTDDPPVALAPFTFTAATEYVTVLEYPAIVYEVEVRPDAIIVVSPFDVP
jgi:hypothetical protein